ncbi:osmotically inducible protein OsmC [Microbulbifer agarilyticus]|uniref:Osmotically inducible protein OsmC n=1 Tax=Microbulbifer agarilyticus TaxID=260552 RepID=A0A1Q2M9R0_9GAMM|nr:alpha/beta fold hydrolase [Microbulbifer agarilyticus]AQQ68942.1 osmotically inducible protein OsmC [Microbulbifer agarilyticus]
MSRSKRRHKVRFPNPNGLPLAGILETPQGATHGFALFAPCFTCGKDVLAASRICRRLADHGIATLRLDFTGLGDSAGDFSETSFSSNVADLICAARFLRDEYQPADLLIGHSFGGAAVLAAAESIPEAKAVATVASPADPKHVLKQFGSALEIIQQEGQAEVQLSRRPFVIRKQFVDDVLGIQEGHIHKLGRPLLIYHSPIDQVVSIDEAADIYNRALHPKSFISLDDADHLLSERADALYVADTLAVWAQPHLKARSV